MVEVHDAGVRRGPSGRWALKGATTTLSPGDRLCLVGPNGAGKSTLLSVMSGSVQCDAGWVEVDGVRVSGSQESLWHAARTVGRVCQDPTARIVASTVADDVAFGPLNLGLPWEEVQRRVGEALCAVGLANLSRRPTQNLSGGEAQRLALASALAMVPSYLALDEVTSELDEGARRQVRSVVETLVDARVGRVWSTHYGEEVLAADRVCLVRDGGTAWEGAVDDLVADRSLLAAAGLADSRVLAWSAALVERGERARSVLDVERAARLLGPAALPAVRTEPRPVRGGAGLELERVEVALEGRRVLDGVSLRCAPGRVTLLAGASGSGKTTLARVAAGLIEPDGGRVLLDGAPPRPGAVGLAFQRPEDQSLAETVMADVCLGPSLPPCDPGEAPGRAARALEAVGLDRDLWDRSPFELSGGQRRRAALAAVVARPCGAYVFDEPTAGLDGEGRGRVLRLVDALARTGAAVCVVSHDLAEWLPVADEACLLAGGSVCWRGPADALVAPGPVEAAGLEPSLELAVARAAVAGDAR